MSHALSNTYKFSINGLTSDFNALDTYNGAEKNGCIGSEAIEHYINTFDTQYDIPDIFKTRIHNMIDAFLTNETNYIDRCELELIINALNDFKKSSFKETGNHNYRFNNTDFEALDTYNGYANNDLIGEEAIRNYMDAVAKHYDFNESTKNLLEWLTQQYLNNGCENAITKDEFGKVSSAIEFANFLNNLFNNPFNFPKSTDKENDSNNKPYRFNGNDFEHLDIFNNYANNNLIGKEAITDYVNRFFNKNNLGDADRKIIDRVIEGFFAGGGDNATSKREFKILLKILESLKTKEPNDKEFNRTFEKLDKYEGSMNGLIGKEAITNYIDEFAKKYNIDDADKKMLQRVANGFLTDGIDNAVSKREFQALWEVMESLKTKKTNDNKSYKFNGNDFEALDTFDGAANNDLIGKNAITDYVTKFIDKYNLSDADKKIIDRVIDGFCVGGGDEAISKREFDSLLKVLESLKTKEPNDKEFYCTFEKLDKYEGTANGLIGKEAITNYIDEFAKKYNIDDADKKILHRVVDGFLTDGIDNAVSKREFQALWEVMESLKDKEAPKKVKSTSEIKKMFDDGKLSEAEYGYIQDAYKAWVKSEEKAGRHRSETLEEAKANDKGEIFAFVCGVPGLGLGDKERKILWDRTPVTTKEKTF